MNNGMNKTNVPIVATGKFVYIRAATPVCQIDVSDEMNVQVGKFFKKHQTRRGKFFSKLLNVQDKYEYTWKDGINVQGEILSQNQ